MAPRVMGSNPLADFHLFFLLNEGCIVKRRTKKSEAEHVKQEVLKEKSGQTMKAIKSGMDTRNGLVHFKDD